MTHILHTRTVYKTALLADEGNSSCCQSSGSHNIKHNLWKLTLRGHLNTDAQATDALTARPQLHVFQIKANCPLKDMPVAIIQFLKISDNITYNKWVRRNNMYQKWKLVSLVKLLQRHAIKSAHFGHEAFTLFTAACYVKSNIPERVNSTIDNDNGLTVVPVLIVSNKTVHERNNAFSCNTLREVIFARRHFRSNSRKLLLAKCPKVSHSRKLILTKKNLKLADSRKYFFRSRP